MENKVMIWGKEVKWCSHCPHYSGYEPCCIIGGFDLNCVIDDNINEKCPYLQPITKESIESYGFEIIEATSNDCEWTFELKGKKIYWMSFDKKSGNIAHISLFSGLEWLRLFRGTINNPMELEFILKSIMLF